MRKRRDYGQISKIEDLPVIRSRGLRADFKNRLFARNQEPGGYGRILKIVFLPVIEDWVLRAYFKNRLFARNRK